MTKIVHRPDPPIEPSITRHRIENNSLIQNREVSAKLFEQSLVKAEGQRRSELKTNDRSADRQAHIDKSVPIKNAVDCEQVLHDALKAHQSQMPTDDVESTLTDCAPEDDLETNASADDEESALDCSTLLFSPGIGHLFDQPISQAFSNRDDHESSPHQVKEFNHAQAERGVNEVNSFGAQCSRLTGLSELDQFIEASDGMAGLKDWSFTFDDDGPIAELTLSFKENQGWNIAVLPASPDVDVIDNQLLENLHHRLEAVGLAVGEVGFFESTRQEK